MRSVWFALIGPNVREVSDHLVALGVTKQSGGNLPLIYPLVPDGFLYISCSDYGWVQEYDLQEEYDQLLSAIGGSTPTVDVSVDVSGRAPGDNEVRYLARCLLQKFVGYVFDDYLSLDHAWTLEEIESDIRIQGLRFFDYLGHHEQRLRAEQGSEDSSG